MKAVLTNIEPTLKGYEITFLVNKKEYKPISKSEYYDLEVRPHHPSKTRTQENYYYSNLRKLASALDISMTMAHNYMLQDYGAEVVDEHGFPVLILMPDDHDYMNDENHMTPTTETQMVDGEKMRWYRVLKPIRDMNTQEMAKLIEGLKQELVNNDL